MVDYGTGSFTLANLGNPATGPDDVFQWNPGDSNTVEDHNTGTRLLVKFHSIPAATMNFEDDAVQDVGIPTHTDWLLV